MNRSDAGCGSRARMRQTAGSRCISGVASTLRCGPFPTPPPQLQSARGGFVSQMQLLHRSRVRRYEAARAIPSMVMPGEVGGWEPRGYVSEERRRAARSVRRHSEA